MPQPCLLVRSEFDYTSEGYGEVTYFNPKVNPKDNTGHYFIC